MCNKIFKDNAESLTSVKDYPQREVHRLQVRKGNQQLLKAGNRVALKTTTVFAANPANGINVANLCHPNNKRSNTAAPQSFLLGEGNILK